MVRVIRIGVVLVGLAGVVGPAAAQGKSRAKDQAVVQTTVSVEVFDRAEVRVIRDYYRESGTRPKPLPPGIAKNLSRGKPLPPGIAKKVLPSDLSRRLTARDGIERVLAGDRVVMVRAGIVIDILAIFD
ncbi:MAG TPA: anti-virulence regulator CigR family protein [Gemmatimonadales bacterium]